MHIKLSPQRRDDTLEVFKAGDVLTVNGEAFDFSSIPAGGGIFPDWDVDPYVPAVPCIWITGAVTRTQAGVLRLTLINPCGPTPTQAADWPDPIIDPPDGRLDIPFSTYQTEEWVDVEDGVDHVITVYAWHQEPVETRTHYSIEDALAARAEKEDDNGTLEA